MFNANIQDLLKISRTYLAADVDGHGVRELEGVEEGVGDDGGPGVRARDLHELGDHLGAQHAAVLVAQVDGPRVLGEGGAGLDPHVELACGQTQHLKRKYFTKEDIY